MRRLESELTELSIPFNYSQYGFFSELTRKDSLTGKLTNVPPLVCQPERDYIHELRNPQLDVLTEVFHFADKHEEFGLRLVSFGTNEIFLELSRAGRSLQGEQVYFYTAYLGDIGLWPQLAKILTGWQKKADAVYYLNLQPEMDRQIAVFDSQEKMEEGLGDLLTVLNQLAISGFFSSERMEFLRKFILAVCERGLLKNNDLLLLTSELKIQEGSLLGIDAVSGLVRKITDLSQTPAEEEQSRQLEIFLVAAWQQALSLGTAVSVAYTPRPVGGLSAISQGKRAINKMKINPDGEVSVQIVYTPAGTSDQDLRLILETVGANNFQGEFANLTHHVSWRELTEAVIQQLKLENTPFGQKLREQAIKMSLSTRPLSSTLLFSQFNNINLNLIERSIVWSSMVLSPDLDDIKPLITDNKETKTLLSKTDELAEKENIFSPSDLIAIYAFFVKDADFTPLVPKNFFFPVIDQPQNDLPPSRRARIFLKKSILSEKDPQFQLTVKTSPFLSKDHLPFKAVEMLTKTIKNKKNEKQNENKSLNRKKKQTLKDNTQIINAQKRQKKMEKISYKQNPKKIELKEKTKNKQVKKILMRQKASKRKDFNKNVDFQKVQTKLKQTTEFQALPAKREERQREREQDSSKNFSKKMGLNQKNEKQYVEPKNNDLTRNLNLREAVIKINKTHSSFENQSKKESGITQLLKLQQENKNKKQPKSIKQKTAAFSQIYFQSRKIVPQSLKISPKLQLSISQRKKNKLKVGKTEEKEFIPAAEKVIVWNLYLKIRKLVRETSFGYQLSVGQFFVPVVNQVSWKIISPRILAIILLAFLALLDL